MNLVIWPGLANETQLHVRQASYIFPSVIASDTTNNHFHFASYAKCFDMHTHSFTDSHMKKYKFYLHFS